MLNDERRHGVDFEGNGGTTGHQILVRQRRLRALVHDRFPVVENAQREQTRAKRIGTDSGRSEPEVGHQRQATDSRVDHIRQNETGNDLTVLALEDLHDRLRAARGTERQIPFLYSLERLGVAEHVRRLGATRDKEVVELFDVEGTGRVRVHAGTVGGGNLRLDTIKRTGITGVATLDQGAVPVLQGQDFLELTRSSHISMCVDYTFTFCFLEGVCV